MYTYLRAYYGGYPPIVTAFRALQAAAEADGRDVLKVHAGDAITGTVFYNLFEGDADAKIMTHVYSDAFAIGNHEFDNGDAAAIVGANIVPLVDNPRFGEGVSSIDNSKVFTMANRKLVGVIGIFFA